MRTLACLTALALASSASAGTLVVEKRGLMPAFAWIDGQAHGKVKNRRPLEVDLDEGQHEVWIALERNGTFTRCHGLVTIGKDLGATVTTRDVGCDGLQEGFGEPGRTHFRGSTVNFTLAGDMDARISVDAGPPLALPNMPFLLNLRPGQHTIVLFRDAMQESILDQGTISLAEGQMLPVTCTPEGCTGFDQPPQPIPLLEVHAAPTPIGIQIQAPGLTVNASTDAATGTSTLQVDGTTVQVDGTTVQVEGTTTTFHTFHVDGIPITVTATGLPDATAASSTADPAGGTATSGGATASTSLSCCVNDAYYDCPDVDAVNQCSGHFMACMAGCDMTDVDCPERCMADHPLDPSSCTRNPALDGTCHD